MMIKCMKKGVWYKKIYFSTWMLSKVTFLHTSHPLWGAQFGIQSCAKLYPRYILAGGYVWPVTQAIISLETGLDKHDAEQTVEYFPNSMLPACQVVSN